MEATINADGSLTPTTGTHWSPYEDPYPSQKAGDVYNAFTKYGFSWGGNALVEQARLHAFQLFRTINNTGGRHNAALPCFIPPYPPARMLVRFL